MAEENYTPEQREAINKVVEAQDQLKEYEKLTQRKYKRQYSMDDFIDSCDADLTMGTFPRYSTMEKTLREAITAAEKLGLENYPGLAELKQIAFS